MTPNSDAVARELLAPRAAPSPARLLAKLGALRGARLRDGQLASALSAVLFVVAAWPLSLTDVPPFQDLPNHIATLTVIEHPELYPEFSFNGFLKTNAALFAWLYAVGKVTGVRLAARLFVLGVLALNALVIPRFVLALTGSRGRMVVASLVAWPMVHNWFVSMGMLDFALGVPLSLALLVALDRQRRSPSVALGATVVGLGLVTWYAHVFPLLVVNLLVAIEIAVQRTWRDRWAAARAMLVPLSPISLLVLVSLGLHLTDTAGPMTGYVNYKKLLPAWELLYNLWAEWLWSFSKLEISTLLPCAALVFFGVVRRKESPTFFSPTALFVLAALYCFLPYIVTNWFHVNSRVVPYVWFALLLRVPDRLPKRAAAALVAAAAAYSVGLGVDYVRLDREQKAFSAGVVAVPEGARLLPLLFRHKESSDNTRNLLHAWGYYVVERHTAAPLLFAHSRSFPVMYSEPPPVRFNHLVLEGFASSMSTPSTMCKSMFQGNMVVDDCDGIFRTLWSQFYAEALPRYDHLLTWDATPEARAVIPPEYELAFQQGKLAIYERRGALSAAAR